MAKTPSAINPDAFTGVELEKPKTVAAGLPAVMSAVQHVLSAMPPARAAKVLFELNQNGGIDCPGCAWPDPDDHRSKLGEYCENGAKAIAEEATTSLLDEDFFAKHSLVEMAAQTDYWIGKRGRIAHPMLLDEGATHYRCIGWNEAIAIIADELKALPSPDRAIFYTSGRTSNEAAFLYQLFVRMYGTNNLPDCSNMCHESSGVALNDTVGIGKGSVTLDDFDKAEVILVVGQNPGTNHPRMLSALKKAKANGAKIITINPLLEAGLMRFKDPQNPLDLMGSGTQLTDVFLPVRINGDVALIKALLLKLHEAEQQSPNAVFDWKFMQQHTDGYAEFEEALLGQKLDELLEEAGITEAQLMGAVDLLAPAKRIITCWAMGLTQHENGVDNIQEIVNLLLVKGSIGIEGGGTCPVRGHSNVQGDRTMGIWEKPKPEFLDRLDKVFQIQSPRRHGLDVVESIMAMHENPGMVFVAMGGNFLSATPDTAYTADALRRCNLTVHISTKLNRSHLVCGRRAIILPSLGRSDRDVQATGEQFVSVENSMGVVHSSRGRLKPLSADMQSEPAMVAMLAAAVLPKNDRIDWHTVADDYDRIRELIEACIPGFERYNERVRTPSGFSLPNGARQRKFNTEHGKAKFTVNRRSSIALQAGQLLMTTIRTHDQFNTTIYGLNDRYRGIMNERRVVLISKETMAELGMQQGDVVDILGEPLEEGRVARRFLLIEYAIPPRCVATYFPEANELVPIHSVAQKSNTPTSKSVVVRLKQIAV